jgi:hypothetical protein
VRACVTECVLHDCVRVRVCVCVRVYRVLCLGRFVTRRQSRRAASERSGSILRRESVKIVDFTFFISVLPQVRGAQINVAAATPGVVTVDMGGYEHYDQVCVCVCVCKTLTLNP